MGHGGASQPREQEEVSKGLSAACQACKRRKITSGAADVAGRAGAGLLAVKLTCPGTYSVG